MKKNYPFFWFVFLFYALQSILPELPGYELSTDEGINIIKSSLLLHGFSLYDQIWSDQPPLFTVVQAVYFRIFGLGLSQGRTLVVIFSALLAWGVSQLVRMERGMFASLCSIVLLFFSGDYLLCSMKIMIGIPALALAVISVYLLYLYRLRQRSRALLFFSAFVFALSVATKIFTVILLPTFTALILLTACKSRESGTKIRTVLLWPVVQWWLIFLSAFVLIGYVCAPAVFSGGVAQLVLPHTRLMQESPGFHWHEIYELAQYDYDFVLLSCLGIISMCLRKNYDFVVPLIWIISSTLFLAHHYPIWHHHYLLISIPLIWLTALSVAEMNIRPLLQFVLMRGRLAQKKKGLLVSALFCLILIASAYHLPSKIVRLVDRFPDDQSEINQVLLGAMEKYRAKTNWVFTDRPVYPFVAQLLVPPELAVFSLKRFESGFLDKKYLVDSIMKYRPEQVLFGRFSWLRRQIVPYLRKDYRMVFSKNGLVLFVRRDIFSS